MHVLSWNINGIRSHPLSVPQMLQQLKADVVCIQETKISRDMLDTATAIVEGYTSYYAFCKTRSGYSGVATYCRDSCLPVQACDSLQDPDSELGQVGREEMTERFDETELNSLDREGRAVLTEHSIRLGPVRKTLVIINTYCPRVDPDKPERQQFQTDFHTLVQIKAEALINAGRHVIITGDLNVSHRKIDHCKPEENPDFENRPSRLWLDQLLLDVHHPDLTTCDNPQCTCGLPTSTPTGDSSEQTETVTTDTGVGDKSVKSEKDSKESETETNKERTKKGKKSKKETDLDKKKTDLGKKITDLEKSCEESDKGSTDREQFVDLFRFFNPSRKEAFTCWCTVTGARATNYGTRLDYVICDLGLTSKRSDLDLDLTSKRCDIMPETEGSDHCPVFAEFDVECIASDRTPACCTKFFPELAGKQSKLSDFFAKGKSEDEQSKNSLWSSNFESMAKSEKRPSNSKKGSVAKKAKLGKSGSDGSNLFAAFGIKRTKSDPQALSEKDKPSDDKTNLLMKSQPTSSVVDNVEMKSNSNIELLSEPAMSSSDPPEQPPKMANAWGALFGKAPPKPKCKGHNEACVLRTVKKDSLNKGRQFWVCAKPEGPKDNPESRCEHFEWVPKPKSGKTK